MNKFSATTLIVLTVVAFFSLATTKIEATNYYPGDLSNKFKETEVFQLTSPSQISKYFTSNLKDPLTGPLPTSISFSGTSVTFTDKAGIGIDNPLKNEPFYKIEVTLNDTNQQNLISYLTGIDNWWSNSFTNGVSVGLNTDEIKSTYWYWHTQFKNQGQIPDSEYTFSKAALARFSKRIQGDTKLELYVTPIGTYAVVNGANFASFPNLYIGPYLFKFTNPLNYIIIGKFNQGGNPVTFKNLKIIKLDSSVASVDEVNAHFIKKTVESNAFTQLIGTTSSLNGTGGFQNALWAAFLYRGYDYYFRTDHRALIQQYIDNYYLPSLTTYIDQNLPRYATESTINVTHSFINSFQWNTYGIYAISDYLTANEKSQLQQQFARVIDTSVAYIKTDGSFPAGIQYKGDTFAEETGWLLSFYTGYYLNFPNDSPRAEKLLDYIAFLGFISTSNGQSLNQASGSTFNFKYLGNEYKNFVAQYAWPDGSVDNHQFHPSLNYGQGVVGQGAVARNSLQKIGINIIPLDKNLEQIYQTVIKGNLNIADFHLLHPNPQFDSSNTNLTINQDAYTFAPDGSINFFVGHTSPSLVEDWGNVYVNYHIIENYGDYTTATQFAKNVYYGFYSGAGKLFCSNNSCDAGTSNFYNYLFGDPLYAMLFSKRSQFITRTTPTPIAGDFTDTDDTEGDQVNLADYLVFKAGFGTTYTIFDYNSLVANFGK